MMDAISRKKVEMMRHLLLKQKTEVVTPEEERMQDMENELRIDFGYSDVSSFGGSGALGVNNILFNP